MQFNKNSQQSQKMIKPPSTLPYPPLCPPRFLPFEEIQFLIRICCMRAWVVSFLHHSPFLLGGCLPMSCFLIGLSNSGALIHCGLTRSWEQPLGTSANLNSRVSFVERRFRSHYVCGICLVSYLMTDTFSQESDLFLQVNDRCCMKLGAA